MQDVMRKIFSVTVKHGGLGITDSARKAKEHFDVYKESSNLKADSIVNATELNAEEHKLHAHRARRKPIPRVEADQGQLFLKLSEQLTEYEKK